MMRSAAQPPPPADPDRASVQPHADDASPPSGAPLVALLLFFGGLATFYFVWTPLLDDATQRSADRPLVLCVWVAAGIAITSGSRRSWGESRLTERAVLVGAVAITLIATFGAVFLPLGVQRSTVIGLALAGALAGAAWRVDLERSSLPSVLRRALLFFAHGLIVSEGWLTTPLPLLQDLQTPASNALETAVFVALALGAALLLPRAVLRYGRSGARALMLGLFIIAGWWAPAALGALAALLILSPASTAEAARRPAPLLARDLRGWERAVCALGLAGLLLLAPVSGGVVLFGTLALTRRKLLLPVVIVGGAILLLLESPRELEAVLAPLAVWLVLFLPWWLGPAVLRQKPAHGADGGVPRETVLRQWLVPGALLVAAGSTLWAVPAVAFLAPGAALLSSGANRRQQLWLVGLLGLTLGARLPPWRFAAFADELGSASSAWPQSLIWLFLLVALPVSLTVTLGWRISRPRWVSVSSLTAVALLLLCLRPWSWALLHEWPPFALETSRPERELPLPSSVVSGEQHERRWVLVLEGALSSSGEVAAGQTVGEITLLTTARDRDGEPLAIRAVRDVADWAAQRAALPAPAASISIPRRDDEAVFFAQRYRWRHLLDLPAKVDGGGTSSVLVRRDADLPNETILTIDRVWLRRPFVGERLD